MLKTDIRITRYVYGDYNIDIIENPEHYEAWLSHKHYGISELMFGLTKKDVNEELFLEIVENNLGESIYEYAEYMD